MAFGIIRRVFHRLRVRKEANTRQIFGYYSNGRKRFADPMDIAMALQTDEKYTPLHLKKARNLEAESMEIVAEAAARAFDMQRLDRETGKGSTIAELIGLVEAFDMWCFQLQKKT
ncbi:MAG: hypothetical protein ACO23H_03245 [Alphaproteobacteria bacterium]